MNTLTRTWRPLLPLAAAAVVSLAVPTSGAAFAASPTATTGSGVATITSTPDPVTATYDGPGIGYDNVLHGRAAGTVKLKLSTGQVVEAFCVNYASPMAKTGTYAQESFASSKIPNIAIAAALATSHAASGKLSSAQAENTATQLAIWSYTNKESFAKVPNAAIVARANALVKGAKATTAGATGYVLSGSASVTGKGTAAVDTVQASLKATDGTPVTAVPVTFTLGGTSQTATTNAQGQATVTVPASTGSDTMTVSASAPVPAGSVFVPVGGQPMVTTTAGSVAAQGAVVLPSAPIVVKSQPKPTPKPKKTVKPHPIAKRHRPSTLPYTGSWVNEDLIGAAAGAALLGLAGHWFFLRRRP